MEQLPHQPPPSPLTIISSTTCICSSNSNTTDIARDFFLTRARVCVCVWKNKGGMDLTWIICCGMHAACTMLGFPSSSPLVRVCRCILQIACIKHDAASSVMLWIEYASEDYNKVVMSYWLLFGPFFYHYWKTGENHRIYRRKFSVGSYYRRTKFCLKICQYIPMD